MRTVTAEMLHKLQKKSSHIRNICIMAHVDHGKTTLADALIASNGIISQRLSGKLRYLDSRKDEQERGITMKSSAISLNYTLDSEDYLINLIDSPGHVDFSSEVSTAVRLCDGAVILVDVVEGVCPQTKVALKQAWLENIQPILVLNKIDRLILELRLAPLDAYIQLTQVLEQVNAVMAELLATEVLGKVTTEKPTTPKKKQRTTSMSKPSEEQTYDWSTGLEDIDDSELYFSPDQGNVLFASAVDGWGFGIKHFAKMFASKVGLREDILQKTLWGDFYLNTKLKRIMRGAQSKAKKPLFVQFVLENLWPVYEEIVIRKDKIKLDKIISRLNLKVAPRDLRSTDPKVQIQAVCGQWLPLAPAVLEMVCLKLPSPLDMNQERAEKLMCSQGFRFDSLPAPTQMLRESFLACSSDEEAPVIVFVSKMFAFERKMLPDFKQRPLTADEIAKRRDEARRRLAERQAKQECEDKSNDVVELTADQMSSMNIQDAGRKQEEDVQKEKEHSDVFLAFARVFSGTLKRGQKLFVLGPKHDPALALQQESEDVLTIGRNLSNLKPDEHITQFTVDQLYLLMGRELESLPEVPAGNVLGIGGLEDHILKSATISNTLACPAFTELQLQVVPILRVAVEPKHPSDYPSLVQGLKLLNQADACVRILLQETGEHVIITAGEVHLQRCIDDLTERFARVEINVSQPIVPFRETIIKPPKTDMLNEAIMEDRNLRSFKAEGESTEVESNDGFVELQTPNQKCLIRIKAVPLPEEFVDLMDQQADVIRLLASSSGGTRDAKVVEDNPEDERVCSCVGDVTQKRTNLSEQTLQSIAELKTKLEEALKEYVESDSELCDVVDHIWSFGPRQCGPNILVNRVVGYSHSSVWESGSLSVSDYNTNCISGFQLATLSGPLCEEPMRGVAFIVTKFSVSADAEKLSSDPNQPYGPFSGQIVSTVKEACRRAFQAQPQRIMTAMYSCNILVNAEVLGRLYAVLGRRHGRILQGDMQEGSSTFNVTAVLPVIESFNFAPEVRKQTSGMAMPQLLFSHWETVDIDPFWIPTTEEEYIHFGEKADTENRARIYMNQVRKRKGLATGEKIVEFGEKQRTLGRSK